MQHVPFLFKKSSAVFAANEVTIHTTIEGLETDGMGTCLASLVVISKKTINMESKVMLFVAKIGV